MDVACMDVAYMDVAYMDGRRHMKLKLTKYIHSKNAFKTILARLEAEIINFLCFEAYIDGRRLYGRHLYGRRLFGPVFSKFPKFPIIFDIFEI